MGPIHTENDPNYIKLATYQPFDQSSVHPASYFAPNSPAATSAHTKWGYTCAIVLGMGLHMRCEMELRKDSEDLGRKY